MFTLAGLGADWTQGWGQTGAGLGADWRRVGGRLGQGWGQTEKVSVVSHDLFSLVKF